MNDADLDALMLWLAEVRNDPYAFVMGAYEWGKLAKYEGPDEWQVELLCRIRDGVTSVNEAVRVAQEHGEESDTSPVMEATTSGHGIGKSAFVAWIIDWAQSPPTQKISSRQRLGPRWRSGTGFLSQPICSR